MRALLLLLLLVASSATAAFNDPLPFEATADFGDLSSSSARTFVSGEAQVSVVQTDAPTAFIDGALQIDGLDHVCWRFDPPQVECTAQGAPASLQVLAGDFAVRLPDPVDVDAAAAHALATFVNLTLDAELRDLGAEPSLVASTVQGVATYGPITPIPQFAFQPGVDPDQVVEDVGVVALMQGTMEIYQNGTLVHTVQGGDGIAVAFTGAPRIAPIVAVGVILPFGAGATADFTPATRDAVGEGLRPERLLDVVGSLAGSEAVSEDPLGEAGDLLREILDGAVFSLPANSTDVLGEGLLARVSSLQILSMSDGVAMTGTAPLEVRQGEVVGSKSLYGFWLIQLPWIGWVLWIAAIAAVVARIVTAAPRTSERWSPYRWVGWVLSPIVLLVSLWLWDREVNALWGTSVMTTDLSGAAYWGLFAVQVLSFFMVIGALVVPLGILLRNTFMLARQGRFMNLATPTALILGLLLGATYFRAYLQLLLERVADFA